MSTKKQAGMPAIVYMSKDQTERVVYDGSTVHIERAFKDAMGGVSWIRVGIPQDRERLLMDAVAHLAAEAERLRNG